MDTFLDTLEDNVRIKKNNDTLNEKYINDINNNLLIPLLSQFDLCEELINFNEIFNMPYNTSKYNSIFEEIIRRVTRILISSR